MDKSGLATRPYGQSWSAHSQFNHYDCISSKPAIKDLQTQTDISGCFIIIIAFITVSVIIVSLPISSPAGAITLHMHAKSFRAKRDREPSFPLLIRHHISIITREENVGTLCVWQEKKRDGPEGLQDLKWQMFLPFVSSSTHSSLTSCFHETIFTLQSFVKGFSGCKCFLQVDPLYQSWIKDVIRNKLLKKP